MNKHITPRKDYNPNLNSVCFESTGICRYTETYTYDGLKHNLHGAAYKGINAADTYVEEYWVDGIQLSKADFSILFGGIPEFFEINYC